MRTLPPPPREEPGLRPASFHDQPTTPVAVPRWRRTFAWLRRYAGFGLIWLLAFALITLNVASPWQSMHEDNGTLNESIAINHLRFGLGVTKGQDLLDLEAKQSFGPQGVSEAQQFAYFRFGPVHPQVYGDHPPLLGLTIAGAFLIFGYHFWSERLVPIAYALAGLIVFTLLVAQVFDLVVARMAALLYATFPMFDYFGRNVSHESEVLFWALLVLLGYLRWRATGRGRWLGLIVAGVVVGGLYGWPLFYFAPLLWALDWLAERRPSRALALATLVPAALTFALVMAQIGWALGGDVTHLWAMFLHRTSGAGAQGAAVTGVQWFNQIAAWNAEGFGGWSQFALPGAVLFIAARASREGWTPRIRLLAVAAAWGLSHVLIFRNGAYVHAYWQFYLLPLYALALGWAAVAVTRRSVASGGWRAVPLVLAGFAAFALNLAPTLALYSTGFHATLPVAPLLDLWR